MKDLIRAKLKEIVELQNVKKYDLNYKSKREKTYNFSNYSVPIAFFRDIHEGNLSLGDADFKQSNSATELKNYEKA